MNPSGTLVAAVLLLALASCSSDGGFDVGSDSSDGEVVFVIGTIRSSLCYQINGDDGENYEPIDLPAEFGVDGLRVHVVLQMRYDLVSSCMVGQIVEVLQIEAL